jgi:hypothetical protein
MPVPAILPIGTFTDVAEELHADLEISFCPHAPWRPISRPDIHYPAFQAMNTLVPTTPWNSIKLNRLAILEPRRLLEMVFHYIPNRKAILRYDYLSGIKHPILDSFSFCPLSLIRYIIHYQ